MIVSSEVDNYKNGLAYKYVMWRAAEPLSYNSTLLKCHNLVVLERKSEKV